MIWVKSTTMSCTTCYDNTYFSQCTLPTQPAMSVSTKQCKMLTRWDSVYFLWIERIHKPIQIFHSENFRNSSYKTMAWKDQVLHASFSSFLSEIQFSWAYEIGQPKQIANQAAQKDTWLMVILILLNSYVEKASLIPLVIQFSVLYGCSAEKAVIGVQLFKAIEWRPEISVISLY